MVRLSIFLHFVQADAQRHYHGCVNVGGNSDKIVVTVEKHFAAGNNRAIDFRDWNSTLLRFSNVDAAFFCKNVALKVNKNSKYDKV